QLARDGMVTLSIYNLLGQEVRTLVNKNQVAGSYSVVWNGRDDLTREVASGVYFYRLKVKAAGKNIVQTRKLLLVR
ncbi:MAG: FlgD immunoglobulin-like domain containing protein, partial [bacterium]